MQHSSQRIHIISNENEYFNIYVYIPAGSIYENDGIRGISHLLEHMLMKRTQYYSNKELKTEITRIGGISNAGTLKDVTYFYIRTHISNYKKAINIMNDIINHHKFTEIELAQEKKVVLEEFAQSLDDTHKRISDLSTNSVLAKNNEYNHPIIGVKKDIETITIQQLEDYFKKTYINHIVIINTDKQYIKPISDLVNMTFKTNKNAEIKKYTKRGNNYAALRKFGGQILIINEHSNQYSTTLAFPTFSIYDMRNIIITNFISFILTQSGFNSLLFSEIREKRGLVYSILSYNEDSLGIGILKIEFSSTNKYTHNTVSIILDIINNNLVNGGISQEEFEYFTSSYLNRVMYIFSSESLRETWQCTNIFYQINLTKEKFMQEIQTITLSEVQNVAKQVFDIHKLGIVSFGKYEKSLYLAVKNGLNRLKKRKKEVLL